MKEMREIDHAGKFYIATSSKRLSNTFRLSCELNAPVNADCLQDALKTTLECFPFFQRVIKKDIFWYYFDKSEHEPSIISGFIPPFTPIYRKNGENLLYRVSCFDNQIHLDIFHALCDGAGAAYFLRLLVSAYLIKLHKKAFGQATLYNFFDLSLDLHELNGYKQHYNKRLCKVGAQSDFSFQIRGDTSQDTQKYIFRGVFQTEDLRRESRKYGVTITELLTVVYINAINRAMTSYDKLLPVTILIPVNLRKYFKSQYAGNFITVIEAKHNFSESQNDFISMLESIQSDFSRQLQTEQLAANFSRYISYELNIALGVIPLFIKDAVLQLSCWYSQKFYTSVLSNLGQIEMPPDFRAYINRFDAIIDNIGIQACAISYENEFCVNIVSAFSDNTIPLAFYEILSEMGICGVTKSKDMETFSKYIKSGEAVVCQ